MLKKAQRLTRRNHRGISTDGFTFVDANGFQCSMEAVARLIVRELVRVSPDFTGNAQCREYIPLTLLR